MEGQGTCEGGSCVRESLSEEVARKLVVQDDRSLTRNEWKTDRGGMCKDPEACWVCLRNKEARMAGGGEQGEV